MNVLTLVIGLVAAVLLIISQVRARRNMQKYNFKVISGGAFALKLLLFTAILVGVTWVLANYRGLPWTAVIVAAVLLIYNFILNKTRLGRSIYAIGGNSEAAELPASTCAGDVYHLLLHEHAGGFERHSLHLASGIGHAHCGLGL